MTDVTVELFDRQPIRVVRINCGILTFNSEGILDPTGLDQHQRARAGLALALVNAQPDASATAVAATLRFVSQGGRWAPSG